MIILISIRLAFLLAFFDTTSTHAAGVCQRSAATERTAPGKDKKRFRVAFPAALDLVSSLRPVCSQRQGAPGLERELLAAVCLKLADTFDEHSQERGGLASASLGRLVCSIAMRLAVGLTCRSCPSLNSSQPGAFYGSRVGEQPSGLHR